MSMIMSLKRNMQLSFLLEGAKLKAFVFFKGSSIIFKEQGQILIIKISTRTRRIR